MNSKLGRWARPVAVAVLILVTAALTTLVNQAFFGPVDSPGDASLQVAPGPDAGPAEPEPAASAEPSNPGESEPGAGSLEAGQADMAESEPHSSETEVDPGDGAAEEPGASEPGPDAGESSVDAGEADDGHDHGPHPEAPEPSPKLCVVADGDPEKLYWRFTEFHAARAAKAVGLQLEYSTHPDAADRVQAIEACARNGAHMIMATLAEPEVIIPAIHAAAELGVQVASFGAGAEFADEAGSLVHVSMDASAAARRAADQFAAAGVMDAVLCLIPEGVEPLRRHICDDLGSNFAEGAVAAHQLAAADPGEQIADLLAAAPDTAGLLVLEADLLPHAIAAMEESGVAPVLGSIGEYPLSKLSFAERDQIAFTVMDLARFEVLLAAAALRLMHTYHPNARFFEGAMIFQGEPNVHTGGARGGHERPGSGEDDGHDHGHGEEDDHHH